MAARTFKPGRVGIVCLGLIGGSFAQALHDAGREVLACNRTEATVELALIETIDGRLDDGTIGTCELIILSGYPQMTIDWLAEKSDLIADGAIVIDACGVKRSVCERCFEIAEGRPWTFVGCHPMAGLHHSGFAWRRADMFCGAPMVVVPPKMDDFERLDVLERIKSLLEPCHFGSYTLATPEQHDRQIAFTSQLAHVVSNAYVKSPTAREQRGFSGGSYRDLTRVACLNAAMWQELFLDNADNLSREIQTIIEHLQQYKDAIDERDAERLEALLAEGDRIKREVDGE